MNKRPYNDDENQNQRPSKTNVMQWQTSHVSIFLAENGFEGLSSRFGKNGIDGPTLLKLNDADLKELGAAIGERKRILTCIESLNSENTDEPRDRPDISSHEQDFNRLVASGYFSLRNSPHSGATKRSGKDIKLIYDADIKDLDCISSTYLLCFGCSRLDKERSYLYIRENSIESNVAISHCCCVFGDGVFGKVNKSDFVYVQYFDRPPHATSCCQLHPRFKFPIFCTSGSPKYVVLETGIMLCCIKISCGESVVLQSFDRCCLCWPNYATKSANCCGLCGPIYGNPIVYSHLFLQPKKAWDFVQVASAASIGTMMRE